MFKFISIIASLLFVCPVICHAQSELASPNEWHSVTYTKGAPEKAVQQCPKTLMTEDCLSCHVTPSFAIKEQDPDDLYDYPNYWTRLREIDGELWGLFFCKGIASETWWDTVDYFKRHKIKNIMFEVHNHGGSLLDAWRMIGYMRQLEAQGIKIHTRMNGMALSAGFLLFISGTDGCRLVHENSEFMWHQLWTFSMFKLSTPASSKEETENLEHLQETARNWVIKKSGGKLDKSIFEKEVEHKEWWLRGSQMIEYGLADGYVH